MFCSAMESGDKSLVISDQCLFDLGPWTLDFFSINNLWKGPGIKNELIRKKNNVSG